MKLLIKIKPAKKAFFLKKIQRNKKRALDLEIISIRNNTAIILANPLNKKEANNIVNRIRYYSKKLNYKYQSTLLLPFYSSKNVRVYRASRKSKDLFLVVSETVRAVCENQKRAGKLVNTLLFSP